MIQESEQLLDTSSALLECTKFFRNNALFLKTDTLSKSSFDIINHWWVYTRQNVGDEFKLSPLTNK